MITSVSIILLNRNGEVDEDENEINVRVERKYLRERYNLFDVPENKYELQYTFTYLNNNNIAIL